MKRIDDDLSISLSNDELSSPCTRPGVQHLRIICDLVPQWGPLDIFRPSPWSQGSISVQDVLKKVHESFRQSIRQSDWALLSPEEQREIGRAYEVRCQALDGSLAELEVERSHGVKRIDYAKGKIWFKGFLTAGEGLEGLEGLKLKLKLTSRSQQQELFWGRRDHIIRDYRIPTIAAVPDFESNNI